MNSNTAIEKCVTELGRCAMPLAQRHGGLAVLTAFSIHVGSSLKVFQESGTLTEGQARDVLRRIASDAGIRSLQ